MHTDHPSISNTRRIAGKVLISLGSILLIGSSVAKFAHVPKVVVELGAMGFDGDRLIAIAVLEMLSAFLFLIRCTRSLGLLLVSAYMGGAVATHVGHGSSPAQPAFVLALLWLGAYLCFGSSFESTRDMQPAVKILPAHLSSNPEARHCFEREARDISSLNHPNICTLHDVGHQTEPISW